MFRSLLLVSTFALAACGRGGNDSLADGAVDRGADAGESAAEAQDIGPPTAAVAAASPAGGGPGINSTAPGANAPTLQLSASGNLIDSSGAVLYAPEGDATMACIGECADAWTPVLAGATQPTGAVGLQGALISVTPRADGSRQVTYAGRPLYRAAKAQPTTAEVRDAFGTWKHVMANATAVPATPAAMP